MRQVFKLMPAMRVNIAAGLLHEQVHFGGPPIPEVVYDMLRSVRNPRERAVLYRQPLQAMERLDWVSRERCVTAEHILKEIRGAETVAGVIVDLATSTCYPSRYVTP